MTSSASQTSGGHKFAPLLWLVNKGERTSTSPLALGYPLLGPSRHVRAYHCMPQSSLGFSAAIHFAMKCSAPSLFCRSAPFPLVLGCSRPLVGVDAESSEVVQETPHPLFSWPPIQPAPPTISTNITHFGSLVSSMRATNPANKIRLLR